MRVSGIDRAASIAAGFAGLIADDLARAGAVPRPASACASAGGWSVCVIITPAPAAGISGLTECDLDCLTLLAQAKEPLSAVRARREMERRGIGIWGEATVKRSLAKLRKMKLVCNSRRGARGYYLPEAAPLVRRAG